MLSSTAFVSTSRKMKDNARMKDNTRKCIQAFFAVPGPVVDYAMTLVSALDGPTSPTTPVAEFEQGGGFALRKMDSGQFGEHSLALLAAPRGRLSKKRSTFGDAAQLDFTYQLDSSAPRSRARN